MRQARGLVPYAAFAVLIVGATVVALVLTTFSGPSAATPAASASPTAVATVAASRAATDLSPSGRLAYWQTAPTGEFQLWLANADNSRRRVVAKSDQTNSVSRTRWAIDGSAVAYVESGVRLVVVRVDGVTTSYTLPPDVRADGYKITDHRFSPSGARIAATVQKATSSQSDVYVAGGGGTWTRLTTTEDVLAADWISEDELLVQTTGGLLARLRASGTNQFRPLTGLASATPIIGDDGRVYFLSGRVTGFAGSTDTLVTAGGASVWSMTADGEDLRREAIALDTDSLRLDGQWPGGVLVHRGSNTAQFAFGSKGAIDLPTSAGQLERVSVAPDKRTAVGFATTNIVRLDLNAQGAAIGATVLLGSVVQGDVWFPRAVGLARIAPPKVDIPAARYAFSLARHYWTMAADGTVTLLRASNANGSTLSRFNLPAPQWSPSGDRLLTAESLGTGASASQLIAVTISRDGTARRFTTPSSVGTTTSWSPDGSQIAVIGLPSTASDVILASDLVAFELDASNGSTIAQFPAREAYWTKAGIVVLTNGTWRTGDRARDAQTIELVANNGVHREVTTVAKIVADARTQAPTTAKGNTQVSALTASGDGAYAAVHVLFLGASPAPTAFAIVRARDGAATTIIAGDPVTDEAWTPNGRLVGYTLTTLQPGSAARQRAVIRDAETGDVVLEQDGRFAGWSPDGAWTYLAKSDGLYARRLAGGDAVRFSSLGVFVSTTKP